MLEGLAPVQTGYSLQRLDAHDTLPEGEAVAFEGKGMSITSVRRLQYSELGDQKGF